MTSTQLNRSPLGVQPGCPMRYALCALRYSSHRTAHTVIILIQSSQLRPAIRWPSHQRPPFFFYVFQYLLNKYRRSCKVLSNFQRTARKGDDESNPRFKICDITYPQISLDFQRNNFAVNLKPSLFVLIRVIRGKKLINLLSPPNTPLSETE